MKHSNTLQNYDGSLEQLAAEIANMDYDSVSDFFIALQQKFHADALHDAQLGHPKLAKHLENISHALQAIVE